MANDIDFVIKDQIGKGMRPTKRNLRDNPYLVSSKGAVPYDGVIQAIDALTRLDTHMLSVSFPYPQLFVFTYFIIICTSTAIYEWNGTTVELKLSGLTAGTTWDAVDFYEYILLTNGRQTVKRSVQTKTYVVDTTVPFGTCLCNFNGQIVLGSPNTQVTGGI